MAVDSSAILRIEVLKAIDLTKDDGIFNAGLPDPYVRLNVDDNTTFATKTINNNTDPEWNEAFEYYGVSREAMSKKIDVEVLDEDTFSRDDLLTADGSVEVVIDSIVETGTAGLSVSLGEAKGSITLRSTWFTPVAAPSGLVPAILRTEVINATNLNMADIPIGKWRYPDPFVILEVGTKEFKTKTIDNSAAPEWNEAFEYYTDTSEDPKLEKIKINVFDKDTFSRDDPLGAVESDIATIVNAGPGGLLLVLEKYEEPSPEPSPEPNAGPSVKPNEKPTEKPSVKLNEKPNEKPSVKPNEKPNEKPSVKPSVKPSAEPSIETYGEIKLRCSWFQVESGAD